MTSNVCVTFPLGFFPVVTLTLTLILTLCFSDFVESSSSELESDFSCLFKCQGGSEEYKTRLTIMESMYTEYRTLKKTYSQYFESSTNLLESWTTVMEQCKEIGPEGILQIIMSLQQESGGTGENNKQEKGQSGEEQKEEDGAESAGSQDSGGQSTGDRDCSAIMEREKPSGQKKESIDPFGNGAKVEVLCDFDVDGGGWTIFQKRSPGSKEDFDRGWDDYVKGFGSVDGSYWLGLENIHALTKDGDQELRIELEDFEGEKKWAKYSSFSVSDASDLFRLTLSSYSPDSTAKDDMISASYFEQNGMQFSTKDKDNDKNQGSCAVNNGGGWWFNSCGSAFLNGRYFEKGETVPSAKGIMWGSWKGTEYSLAKAEMKIRKRQ